MKYFIFISKLLLDALRDTIKIVNYFKLRNFNGFFVVLKLFLIRFFYAFPYIRNLKKINLDLSLKDEVNLCYNYINLNNTVKAIDIKGYTETFKINNDIFEKIKQEILNNNNNVFAKKNLNNIIIRKNDSENEKEYLMRLTENRVSRVTGVLNLDKSKYLREVVLSKELIQLVSSYINSKILSINASYFISLPVKTSEQEKFENAQYFHWDNDFRKFLKLYIYLTDVDDFSGPHVYVEGSHKYKKFKHSLPRLYSDEDINNSYSRVKKFYGKKGSFFLTDSYGLHKGEKPKSSARILLNIHFGSDKIKYHPDDLILKV